MKKFALTLTAFAALALMTPAAQAGGPWHGRGPGPGYRGGHPHHGHYHGGGYRPGPRFYGCYAPRPVVAYPQPVYAPYYPYASYSVGYSSPGFSFFFGR